jgi:O-antigen ligase
MAFCLPFSSALTQVFSYFAVFSAIILVNSDNLRPIFSDALVKVLFGLWLFLTVSVLWTVAPLPELIEGWSKYRKLLFSIFFLIVFLQRPNHIWYPLKAFTICNGVLAFLACLVWLGVDQWRPPDNGIFVVGSASNPTIGRNHITQGAFQVMSACLSLGFAFASKGRYARTGWILVCTLTLISSLGLLQGRTGYLLAAIAAVSAVILLILLHRIRGALIVVFFSIAIFSFFWSFSPNLSKRTAQAIESIEKYTSGVDLNTDQGIRLQFYVAGLKVFSESPFLGHGVGSFAEAYSRLPNENADLQSSRAQPHSEYINLLVQGGLIGLGFFVLVGLIAIKYAWRSARRPVIASKAFSLSVIVVLFWSGAVVNSYIWDLAEGHLFIIILGTVIAVELLRRRALRL